MKIRGSIILLLLAELLFSDVYDNGIGAGAAFGVLSGGVGLTLEYQIAYRPKSRITPFIGAGISDFWLPGYSAGVISELGYSNRFFSALSFGSWGVETESTNGGIVKQTVMIGPSLICGYKRVFANGQMFNVGAGILVPLNDENTDMPVMPAVNFGYGHKFGKKRVKISHARSSPSLSLPSKYRFLNDLDSVSYIITDPKHLIMRVNNVDTSNQMYGAIKAKIYERIQKYSLVNFDELPDVHNRQVAVAFNNSAYKSGGILDSLPYALWERCIDSKVKYFAAFYLYKTSEGAEVERNEIEFVNVPVPDAFGMVKLLDIPIYITLENIQIGFAVYDVRKNRLLTAVTSNDEDYESPVELIEDLFQVMGLR